MKRRSPAALEATAFHEAGHAVAAWHAGLKIHGATIVPARDRPGHVTHANPLYGVHLDYDGPDEARLRAEADIVVLLAGPAAQRRHNPRSWRSWHGTSDHERAVDLAMRLNGSDEATSAHLAWLAIVARDEVDTFWDLVDQVARELIEASHHRQTAASALPCGPWRPSPMTDNPSAQQYLRLMASEDTRFVGIHDLALDDVLRSGQEKFVNLIRGIVDEISKLPDAGPACEARRRTKLTWLSAVLASLQPLQ
jgi:hypothetical protein